MFLIASTIIHAAILFSLAVKSPGQNPATPKRFDVDLVARTQPLAPDTTQHQEDFSKPAASPKPAELIKKNKAVRTAKSSSEKNFQSLSALPVEKEATVSLYSENRKQTKYSSYLQHLRQKIDAVWEYPASAKEQAIEGELTLVFSIEKTGGLMDVKLLQSSGHAVLDQEAIRTIQGAAPFNPLPPNLSIARLNVHASFKYQFSSD